MAKGIRQFVNTTFNNTLPQLAELGPIEFRREVMAQAVMAFEITIASAATHYNHALKMARIADPKAVEKLGRDESNKGGRKPVSTVDVIKVKTGEVVASGVSKAAAELLISKAAESKKAKLAIKEAAAAIVAADTATAPANTATATTEGVGSEPEAALM